MLVFKPTGGLGNTLIQLTSMPESCRLLHDSVYDYELSNCVTIKGFTRVSEDGEQPETPIYINPFTIRHVHSKIRDIIEPTPYMKKRIDEHLHLLDGVSCGMSIRRGSYCEDSRQFKDERGDRPEHFFCSEQGLLKFYDVIRKSSGKVFVSSDSKSTMDAIKKTFGDKIVSVDTAFAMIMDQDGHVPIDEYHKVFLKFFLMSACPKLYLTGGRTDFVGFSTYAYMAAIYGNKPFDIVFN
jgi:hypothetical protein